MSAREVRVSDLAGCKVYDAAGTYVGRISELSAEIELHAAGNDYVVSEFHLSHYGALDRLATNILVQQIAERLGRAIGYACYKVPWEWMDLRDIRRPRLTRSRAELISETARQ